MSLRKSINSFNYATKGLKAAWKEERNFRIEVIATIIVVICILYFKFTFIEAILCVIAVSMVLGAELVNTALEDMCDKIEPAQNPAIGRIKDIMAALVLVNVCAAIIIGLLTFYHHFAPLF